MADEREEAERELGDVGERTPLRDGVEDAVFSCKPDRDEEPSDDSKDGISRSGGGGGAVIGL